MKPLIFNELPSLTFEEFYPIFIIFGVALITFLVLFIVIERKRNVRERDILQRIDSMRIYVLDFKQDSIIFFNRNNLSEKKCGSLDLFFNQVHPDERERVRNWLLDLLAEDALDVAKHMEADVLINRETKSYFSLFQIIKVNKEEKRIYLESYLLRYLTPRLRPLRRTNQLIINELRAQELFDNYRKSAKGTTSVIRLYRIGESSEIDERAERLIMTNLLDKLTPYLGLNRLAMILSDYEVAIFDYKQNSKVETLRMAYALKNELARFLGVNGLTSRYGFSIGVAENSQLNSTYEITVTTAREMAIRAQNKFNSVSLYDATFNLKTDRTSKQLFRDELNSLIKKRQIKITYRAIIEAGTPKTIGYFSEIEPVDSLFNNFYEIKEYASQTKQSRELFALIAKETIATFYNQCLDHDLKLFLPVTLADFQAIGRTLPSIPNVKQLKLILRFEENDLSLSHTNEEEVYETLNELVEEGYSLALVINDDYLSLNTKIYQLFSWFVLDKRMTKNIHIDDRIRIKMASALEKLIKYKRPMIINDLNSWTAIEFVLKSGMRYLSSEEIAPASEMILPVEDKKLMKTRSLIEYK